MLKFSRILCTVVLVAFLLLPAGLAAQTQTATRDSAQKAAPDSLNIQTPAQQADSKQDAGSQLGIAVKDIVPWVFAVVMAILAHGLTPALLPPVRKFSLLSWRFSPGYNISSAVN